MPTYAMAYFTGQMVWVVPTLAACGFFAGTISLDDRTTTQRVDEDSDGSGDLDETLDIGLDEDAGDG